MIVVRNQQTHAMAIGLRQFFEPLFTPLTLVGVFSPRVTGRGGGGGGGQNVKKIRDKLMPHFRLSRNN